MTSDTRIHSPGVRHVELDCGSTALSGLLSEPAGPPRATVVALHGSGMSAGYFDGQAHPDLSLLTLGAALGFTVLSIDRPGYGRSSDDLPEGANLEDQVDLTHRALGEYAERHVIGDGILLLAHSFGGTLALSMAVHGGRHLLGLDISGCGQGYAEDVRLPASLAIEGRWKRDWGPLRLYPPNTFRLSGTLVSPVPGREWGAAKQWPEAFGHLAPDVHVPVRFTFAEHESWWRADSDALAELESRLVSAPRVLVDRQPSAGHNISLGWTARSYHLRAFAFLEQCLVERVAG